MFQELMPLLVQRTLIVTLSRVSDEQISVNIIPKPLKFDQQNNDGAALTTPLSVTGTPKELDEQLPRQLVEFVETHLELSSTLKSAKQQMEAAAKAAREAAEKSTSSKSHGGSSKSAARTTQVPKEAGAKESPDDSPTARKGITKERILAFCLARPIDRGQECRVRDIVDQRFGLGHEISLLGVYLTFQSPSKPALV
jgi:PRTRC genetic system protein E